MIVTDYIFPKTLGACADRYYKLRESRLALSKKVAAIEVEEKAIKAHIIDELPMSKASGIAGKLARVAVVQKDIYQVKDQVKFRAWLSRNKRWDAANNLQASAPAMREVFESGKKVPGIEIFHAKTLSMNKL